ncbi:MAG TPA: D-alanyl-D-alanine carboxypeptidase/D-alanyl-D-alanine-endopeptidase, partial [Candidatus Xenobia bacterium]
MKRGIWALAVWCMVLGPVSANTDGVLALRQKIAKMVAGSPVLFGASVGIYLKALDDGHVPYTRNPSMAMMPASNFKVLTVGVALDRLGADYRYETKLLAPPNAVQAGVLHGNLVLKGTGDPSWLDPWERPAEGVLEDFADALDKQGVHEIDGDLVGDDSAFDREFLGRGWKQRYLNCDYAAQCAALSLNGNLVNVNVEPSGIRTYPKSPAIHIMRQKSSRGGSLAFSRRYGTNDIHISGTGFGGSAFTVNNPSLFTLQAFHSVLARHKIKVVGAVRLVDPDHEQTPADFQTLALHKSKPLIVMLRYLCKESDNFFAQHVFKELGYVVKGKGTLENSSNTIYDFMRRENIDPAGMMIADGCGLSVLDRISARQMVDYLGALYNLPIRKLFMSTLARAGKDGTMSYRLAGLPVWAKTGTINGTCTL